VVFLNFPMSPRHEARISAVSYNVLLLGDVAEFQVE
jgi:hypothetical protein